METELSAKRRRSHSPIYHLNEDDSYEPYVPVAQRRQAKLAKLLNRGSKSTQDKTLQAQRIIDDLGDRERDEEELLREKRRKDRTLLVEAQEIHSKKAAEGMFYSFTAVTSLFTTVVLDAKKTEGEKRDEADAEILAAIASRRKLASDLELARGINYTESIQTSYFFAFYFLQYLE
jgi:ATP-dependent RNA helicase DDX41